MSARTFLVHGLVAGLLAGLAAFAVAFLVGEPQVQKAVDREEAGASAPASPHLHSGASATAAVLHTTTATVVPTHTAHGHDHEGGEVVSRGTQRTWGLLTGSLAVGTALGGVIGLVAAATLGRLGRLTPRQSTATIALLGFVSFAFVPFWKYPANPPGVGSGDTIGTRTAEYFGFVVVSVVVAVAATVLASRATTRRGAFTGVLAGGAVYLVVVVAVGFALPAVDAAGDFPADLLWSFRRASLATVTTMWAVLGLVLTALVGREHGKVVAAQERRAHAAAL